MTGPPDLNALSHPLRAALSGEMHIRRLPRFVPPSRMMQIVTLTGEEATRAHVAVLRGSPVEPGERYAVFVFEGLAIAWERHSEFASYMLIKAGPFDAPFDPGEFGESGQKLLAEMPGEVVRATQIAFLGSDAPSPDAEMLATHFAPEGLIVSDLLGGKARLWSDFRLNPDGYGRLLIADKDLAGDEAAQLVQRVQELGNYRNMALLGLPLAQRLTPDVTRLEARLAALTQDVSERRSDDDVLLDELTFLSAELARLLAETRYRMNATRAYAQLSFERLHGLGVEAVRGFQTLSDFTERRLMPALRTCESFSQRLDDLSQRAAWTSSLLRTRVDTALARQNRDLLSSMDRRTKVQLRLQQAVEGLSVVAISYYLLALMSYVVKAMPGWDHERTLGLMAPIVVAAVTLAMIRVHRRLLE